jgi:uncharacterized UBP type Zn finger protein
VDFTTHVALEYYAYLEVEEINERNKRRFSEQTSSETGRQRNSLTVNRLVDMGFNKSDAEASVEARGNDPEKCMMWIIRRKEESEFLRDLNQASIASEESKRKEAEQLKKIEQEALKKADSYQSLFPTVSNACSQLSGCHQLI